MRPARAPARRLPLEREAARSSLPVEKNGRTGVHSSGGGGGWCASISSQLSAGNVGGGGGTRAPAAVRIARQSRRLALRCGRVLAGGLCLQQHAAGTTRGRLARSLSQDQHPTGRRQWSKERRRAEKRRGSAACGSWAAAASPTTPPPPAAVNVGHPSRRQAPLPCGTLA